MTNEDFSLNKVEKQAIIRAMRQVKGKKREAAKLLKIGVSTLYRKLRMYKIVLDDES